MVKVETPYVFDTLDGRRTLADLFAGRSQLIVYHFMMGPGWMEGCPSCSFLVDHLDGAVVHLANRDVTLVAVSRAPLAEIEAFKRRMGWHFTWVSSYGTDFNCDFHVSFTKDEVASGKMHYNYEERLFPSEEGPGFSVFWKNAAGEVFHTYSTYGRGGESVLGTYHLLDLVPKGRDEDGLPFPDGLGATPRSLWRRSARRRIDVQFALLIYEPPEDFETRDTERGEAHIAAWRSYYRALVEAGVYVTGAPLQPDATGTTVRVKGGQRQVQDGPYADTKEQLGGFIILELPTLDAALEWAARCPTASTGAIEVRPVVARRPRARGGHGWMTRTAPSSSSRDESYGRLVAYLSARTRDVAAAEDALGDAFMAALRTWPRDGVPLTPEAWLLTTARRRLIDQARHQRVRADAAEALRLVIRESEAPGRGALSRRAAEADVRVRAPRDRSRGAHAVDAAGRARPGRGDDRQRVPDATGDDGAAIEPGEDEDSRRARSRSRFPIGGSCRSGSMPCSMRSTRHMAAAGTMSPAQIRGVVA